MSAFSQFLIYKQLDIYIPGDRIKDSLDNYQGDGFTIEQVNDNEYKFLANFSLGTMFTRGGFKADGIKVNMVLDPFDRVSTHITLRTRMRPELIFITIFVIAFLAFVIFGGKKMPFHNDLLYIPFMPIWFWLIYRLQEYYLLTKIEKYFVSLK